MVSIISGDGLGLYNTSLNLLNQSNSGSQLGNNGDQLYVNTTTGNLVIRQQDEFLSSAGAGLNLLRTYNSLGQFDDDNGDNWRLNVYQELKNIPATPNTVGSSVTKVYGDGHEAVFNYDAGLGYYISTDGDGAHDTLSFNSTNQEWVWTDGTPDVQEVYDSTGRLITRRDNDDNEYTYIYSGSLITQINDIASGQTVHLDYAGTNLTQIRTTSDGVIQSRVHYTYDTQNRLSQVIFDLTPADSDISAGDPEIDGTYVSVNTQTYVTTYEYDGSSRRVAKITTAEGVVVSFAYDVSGRIKTVTDGLGQVTEFNYNVSTQSQSVTSTADATALTQPTAAGSWTGPVAIDTSATGINKIEPQVVFDDSGNGYAIWVQVDGSTRNLYANRFVAGQDWLGPELLEADIYTSVANPQLSLDTQGNLFVVWRQSSANGSVFVNRYDAASQVWSGAQAIGNGPWQAVYAPQIATNDQGDAIVAWYQDGNLYASRFFNSLGWQAAELVQSGVSSTDPLVYLDSSGDVMLAWVQSDGTNNHLFASRFDSLTQSWGAATQIEQTAGRLINKPHWSADAQGNLVVVWTMQDPANGYQRSAYAMHYQNGIWETPITLAANGDSPQIAVNAAGRAMAIWAQSGLYASEYVPGQGWGAATQVQGGGVDNYHVALDGQGNATVIWTGGWDESVYARRYSVTTGWEAIEPLEGISNMVTAPQLHVTTGGDISVIWVQGELSWNDYRVFIDRYETSGSGAPYYTVQAGDSWASITQTVYGTSEASAITTLQDYFAQQGVTVLNAGDQLVVPDDISYTIQVQGGVTQTNVIAPHGAGSDPARYTTTYIYDDQGRISEILSPPIDGLARLSTTYGYDADSNITGIIDGNGHETLFSYDMDGNLDSQQDAVGNTAIYLYDLNNRIINETVYLTPDADGLGPLQASDPVTTRYIYDSEGHLRFVVSAEGRVTETRYNTAGLAIASINYNSGYYDLSLLDETDILTEAQLSSWITSQDLSKIQRSDISYDFRGNVETTTAWATLDTAGNGVADGQESVTTYVYDQFGSLLQTVAPKGVATSADSTDFITSYTYDGLGRLLTSTDAQGNTTVTDYDDANNRIINTLVNGLATTSIYNVRGELVSINQTDSNTSQALGTTTYQYDADSNLRITTAADGTRTHYLYDQADRIVATIDATGSLTETVYDGAGNLFKLISYADRVDAAGLASLVDVNGDPADIDLASLRPAADPARDRVSYTLYDQANRPLIAVTPHDTDATQAYVAQSFYDGAGRITDIIEYATAVDISISPTSPSDIVITPNVSEDRHARRFYDNDGRLIGSLDAAGYFSENVYDAAGQLIETVAYANHITDNALRTNGDFTQIKAALIADNTQDQHNYFFYDAKGQVIGSLDAEGYLSESTYDINGNVTSTVRYYNKANIYSGNESIAQLRPATHTNDAVTTSTYNQLDLLSSVTNVSDGTVTEYEYDAISNLIRTTTAANSSDTRTVRARYDVQGRVIAELTPQGAEQLQILLDSATYTQTELDAIWDQYAIFYNYDVIGRRISSTDQNNHTSYYYYDDVGRLTHSVNARGEVVEQSYDSFGQVIRRTAYNGRIATTGLSGGLLSNSDLSSRLAAIADAASDSSVETDFSLRGAVTAVRDALGYQTSNVYNAFAEVVNTIRPIDSNSTTSQFDYDQRGQLIQLTEDVAGQNRVSNTQYDAFGRVIQSTDGNGNVYSNTYDRLGRRLTSTDPSGIVTTSYDAFSRVLTITDRNGNSAATAYDDATNTITLTTAGGIVSSTQSNRHGETIAVTDGKGNTTNYTYNRNGQLESITDAQGNSTTTNYDAAGLATESIDANGNVVHFNYDAANRVSQQIIDPTGLNLITSYTYDGQGRTITVTDANNVDTVTSYDNNGQVLSVTVDPAGLNLRSEYVYNKRGQTVEITEGAGTADARTTRYQYDNLGRRTQQTVDPAGLAITTVFTYDDNDNVIARSEAAGSADERTTRFIYDSANRLTHSVDASGAVTESFYDNNSNIVKTIVYATSVDISTLPLGISLSHLSGLSSSANDRITRYGYDADDRLQFSVNVLGELSENVYDDNGNIIRSVQYATAIGAADIANIDADLLNATATIAAVRSQAGFIDALQDRINRSVFDSANRQVFNIDALGYVTESRYDGNGNIVRQIAYADAIDPTLADAGATAVTNVENALVAQIDNGKNRDTLFYFDKANRQTYSIDALGYVRENKFDDVGRVQQSIAYFREVDRSGLGGNNDLSAVQAALTARSDAQDSKNQITQNIYDTAGRLSSTTSGFGSADAATDSYEYDALDQQIAHSNGNGDTEYFAYDGAGRVTRYIDYAGYVKDSDYDAFGNLIKQTTYMNNVGLPGAADPRWAYYAPAITPNTDPVSGDRISYFFYDAGDRQIVRVDPITNGKHGKVTQYVYDSFGNLTDTVEARGLAEERAIHREYDVLGRVVEESIGYLGTNYPSYPDVYDQFSIESQSGANYSSAGDFPGWSGENRVTLGWQSLAQLGSGTVRIELDYILSNDYGQTSNQTRQEIVEWREALKGVSLSWMEPDGTGDARLDFKKLSGFNSIKVYKELEPGQDVLVFDYQNGGLNTPQFITAVTPVKDATADTYEQFSLDSSVSAYWFDDGNNTYWAGQNGVDLSWEDLSGLGAGKVRIQIDYVATSYTGFTSEARTRTEIVNGGDATQGVALRWNEFGVGSDAGSLMKLDSIDRIQVFKTVGEEEVQVFDYNNGALVNPVTIDVGSLTNASTSRFSYDAFGNQSEIIQPRAIELTETDSEWALAERQRLAYVSTTPQWLGLERLDAGTGTPRDWRLESDQNGNAIAVWIEEQAESLSLASAQYDPDAGWGKAELIDTLIFEDVNAPLDDSLLSVSQLRFDSNGNAFIAWIKQGVLSVKHYAVDAGWQNTQVFALDAGNPNNNSPISGKLYIDNPQLDIDALGNAFVTWYTDKGSGDAVYGRRYDAAMQTWEAIVPIKSAGTDIQRLGIDVSNNGDAVIYWQEGDFSGPFMMNRYDANSGTWQGPELVTATTNYLWNLKLAYISDGSIMAVWADSVTNTLTANRYVAGTGWQALGDHTLALSHYGFEIKIDDSGNTIVTSSYWDGVAQDVNAYATVYDATSGWQAEYRFDDSTLNNPYIHDIEFDVGGKAILGFTEETQDGLQLFFRDYDFNNGWQDIEAYSIAAPNSAPQKYAPQFALDANDRKVVITAHDVNGQTGIYGNGEGIVAKRAVELTPTERAGLQAAYVEQQHFDKLNRKIDAVDAYGAITATEYDAFGNIVKAIDPNGNPGYFYYDSLGRLTLQVDPEGYASETIYDAYGNVIESIRYYNKVQGVHDQSTSISILDTAPTGTPPQAYLIKDVQNDQHTLAEYDTLNRSVKLTDAENYFETFIYDSTDNVVLHKDKNGYSTTYVYDANGNRTKEFLPINSVDSQGYSSVVLNEFTYDALGNRIQSSEAVGLPEQKDRQFVFDKYDRLIETIEPDIYTSTAAIGVNATVTHSNDLIDLEFSSVFGWGVTANWSQALADGGGDVRVVLKTENGTYENTAPASDLTVLAGTSGVAKPDNGTAYTVSVYKVTLTGGELVAEKSGTFNWVLQGVGFAFSDSVQTAEFIDFTGLPPDNTLQIEYWPDYEKDYVIQTNILAGTTGNYRWHFPLTLSEAPYAGVIHYEAKLFDTTGDVVSRISGYFNSESRILNWQNELVRSGEYVTPYTYQDYDNRGNLISETDAKGNITRHYYDSNNNRIATLDAEGYLHVLKYDSAGNLIRRRTYGDKLPDYTTSLSQYNYAYLPDVSLIPEVNEENYRETYYAYDRSNRLVEERSEEVLVYDRATGKHSGPLISTKRYDAIGRLTAETDANGNSIYYFYTKRGDLTGQVDQSGYIVQWQRDANGNIVQEHKYATLLSAASLSNVNENSDFAALIQEVSNGASSADDRVTVFEYDRLNRQIAETVVDLTYSDVSVSLTAKIEESASYNTSNGQWQGSNRIVTTWPGLPIDQTFSNIRVVIDYIGLDGNGAQVPGQQYIQEFASTPLMDGALLEWTPAATDALAAVNGIYQVTKVEVYDVNYIYTIDPPVAPPPIIIIGSGGGTSGSETSGSGDNSEIATLLYSQDNPPTVSPTATLDTQANLAPDARTATISYQYDGLGNIKSIVQADGGRTDYVYDGLSRRVQEQNPSYRDFSDAVVRQTTEWTYDGVGNIKSVTEKGASSSDDFVTTHEYDPFGNVIKTIDPEGSPIQYYYDLNGNIAVNNQRRTNPNGTAPAIDTIYNYDKLNRQIATTDAKNFIEHVTYNAYGEITAKGTNGSDKEYFEYDAAGRLIKTNAENGVDRVYLYDANGNATSEIKPAIENIELEWYTQGQAVLLAQDPDRLNVSHSEYDVRNQLLRTFQAPMEVLTENVSFNELWVDAQSDPTIGGELVLQKGGITSYVFDQYIIPDSEIGTSINVSWPPIIGYGDGSIRVEWTSSKGVYNGYTSSTQTSVTVKAALTPNGLVGLDDTNYYRIYKQTTDGEILVDTVSIYIPNNASAYGTTAYGQIEDKLHIKGLSPDVIVAEILLQQTDPPPPDNIAYLPVPMTQVTTVSGEPIKGWYTYDVSGRPAGSYDFEIKTYLPPELSQGTIAYDAQGEQLDYLRGSLTLGGSPAILTHEVRTTVPISSPGDTITNEIVHSQSYNAFGEVISEVDQRGHALTQLDDDWALQERLRLGYIINDAGGDRAKFVSELTETEKQEIIARYTTHISYNKRGQVIQQQAPLTQVTHENGIQEWLRPTTNYYYDINGFAIAQDDANGNRTLQQYDDNGNLRAVFNADAGVRKFSYDAFGNKVYEYNELGYRTEYKYDSKGNVVQITRPVDGTFNTSNRVETFDYDEAGRRIRHTNALGNVAETYYDAIGRVTRTVGYHNPNDPNDPGDSTWYRYLYNSDTNGLRVSITTWHDGKWRYLSNEYDYFGKVTYHRDLGNRTYFYIYNQAGNLVKQIGNTDPDLDEIAEENLVTSLPANIDNTNFTSLGIEQYIEYKYYHNGYISDVIDYGVDSHSKYQYDVNGNRIFEGYAKLSTGGGQVYYQWAKASYDELNRVYAVDDPRFRVSYEYDANGNRRHIYARYHDGTNNGVQEQDYWYTYDNMNRFVVSKGRFARIGTDADGKPIWDRGNSSVERGQTGYIVSYDVAGQRRSVEYQTGSADTEITRESYQYNAAGLLTQTHIKTHNESSEVLRAERAIYDAVGNVLTYREYNNGTHNESNTYYTSNRLKHTDVSDIDNQNNPVENYTVDYYYYSDGNLQAVKNTQKDAVFYTNYKYDYWDTAVQSEIKAVGEVLAYDPDQDWKPGFSNFTYDANGHIVKVTDEVGGRHLSYAVDSDGRILQRNELNGSSSSRTQYYYYLNGIGIGDSGSFGPSQRDYASIIADRAVENDDPDAIRSVTSDVISDSAATNGLFKRISRRGISRLAYTDRRPVQSGNFDYSYLPITDSYPAKTPGTYTLRTTDIGSTPEETLRSVSLAVWGDASFWYLIADANGLNSASQLAVNQVLVIPNVVTNSHNNEGTFRVYNPGLLLGDISPTLPDPPPPPPQEQGCGVAEIIITAVTIAVTIYAPELLPEATSSLTAAFLGAAAGNAAGQLTAITLGVQDEFDWSAVGAAGLRGAATSFINVDGLEPTERAVAVASRNFVGQFIDGALSGEVDFDWRALAASAISDRLVQNIAGSQARIPDTDQGWDRFTQEFSQQLPRTLTTEAVNAPVLKDHKPSWASVAGDTLGTALGNTLAAPLRFERQQARIREGIRAQELAFADAGIPFTTTNGQVRALPKNDSQLLANSETYGRDPISPLLDDSENFDAVTATNIVDEVEPVIDEETRLQVGPTVFKAANGLDISGRNILPESFFQYLIELSARQVNLTPAEGSIIPVSNDDRLQLADPVGLDYIAEFFRQVLVIDDLTNLRALAERSKALARGDVRASRSYVVGGDNVAGISTFELMRRLVDTDYLRLPPFPDLLRKENRNAEAIEVETFVLYELARIRTFGPKTSLDFARGGFSGDNLQIARDFESLLLNLVVELEAEKPDGLTRVELVQKSIDRLDNYIFTDEEKNAFPGGFIGLKVRFGSLGSSFGFGGDPSVGVRAGGASVSVNAKNVTIGAGPFKFNDQLGLEGTKVNFSNITKNKLLPVVIEQSGSTVKIGIDKSIGVSKLAALGITANIAVDIEKALNNSSLIQSYKTSTETLNIFLNSLRTPKNNMFLKNSVRNRLGLSRRADL